MNPDKQRVAIAKACGWIAAYEEGSDEGCGRWFWHRGNQNLSQPPDYPHDLNAMHDAEKVLFTKNDWRLIRKYFAHLSPHLHSDEALDGDDWKLCHASAAQRAEAFLKTLNLWESEL